MQKILSGSLQKIYACTPNGIAVDNLLADDWMFFLTNHGVGYSTEGEAWQALADFKNQKKKIDLAKAKRTALLN